MRNGQKRLRNCYLIARWPQMAMLLKPNTGFQFVPDQALPPTKKNKKVHMTRYFEYTVTPLSQANTTHSSVKMGPHSLHNCEQSPSPPALSPIFFTLIGPTRMPSLLLDCTLALWTKILHRKVYFSHDRPEDDLVV